MQPFVILAGPSAVGKTTVMENMLRLCPALTPIRSATTRPRRSASESEYLHMQDAAFLHAAAQGAFLEHTVYGAYRYGTPKSEISRAEAEGRIPLLILERSGIRSVKNSAYGASAFAVYLYDDLSVAERRLRERVTDTADREACASLCRRLAANAEDYTSLPDMVQYLDVLIKNDTSPEDTAIAVLAAFHAFCRGECAMEAEARQHIAQTLAAQAKAYRIV